MTTPPSNDQVYNLISNLGIFLSPMVNWYQTVQSNNDLVAEFSQNAPEKLQELLNDVGPVRVLEDTLHTAINAPDPIDPVTVFNAYQPVFNAFAAAQVTYNTYINLNNTITQLNADTANYMSQFVELIPQLKEQVSELNDILATWEPPTE